jgi:HTH-type transcriptional regulator / antitoxin HigA
MAKNHQINELFLAAADIEAGTPITVGANMVGPNGRFTRPQPVKPQEWDAWAGNFPLKEMRRLNFSLPTASSAAEAVLGFFGVSSPESWQAAWQATATALAFRQTKVFDARQEAVAAWVREAEIIASSLPLADFDEHKLRSSLGDLRRVTQKKIGEALTEAQQICWSAGVAFVVVGELPGTRISGCARWLNDKHAMVGLTLRYKTDDQFWFTFFHEVGHILLHRERELFVIDNAADEMGDDVVDPNMAKYEEEADRFACDTLIPPAALAEFVRRKKFASEDIYAFAESIGIGPGIVVGRLQHDGVLKWHQGNSFKQELKGSVTPEGS